MRALAALLLLPSFALTQDRLARLPGYERYEAARKEIAAMDFSVPRAVATDDGIAFQKGGKWVAYDPATKTLKDRGEPVRSAPPGGRRGPERGRQYDTVIAPDGKWRAVCAERDVILESTDGKDKIRVTRDGSVAARIKSGTASWVYGEELGQIEAMWFSPDSKRLAYYRFDESKVPDYLLAVDQGSLYTKPYAEAYPKSGQPNPTVELYVYDLVTRRTTRIDTGFKSFDPDLAQYIYGVRWADANRLMFLRMNRLQNAQELCIADAATGGARAFHRETYPQGWVDARPGTWENSTDPIPTIGGKMLWITEANGFRNLMLVSPDGGERTLTKNLFDTRGIVRVDEKRGEVWYEASSPTPSYANHVQLHRVDLKGHDTLLTEDAQSHTVVIAKDGESFADTAETWEQPPVVTLRNRDGKALAEIGRMTPPNWPVADSLPILAADGDTIIYGHMQYPRAAKEGDRVPMILDVYAGPESGTDRERFVRPDPRTELGFAIGWVDGRGTKNRGRAFRESVYRKLGGPEIDDQATFVRVVSNLGPVKIDPKRVGISGVSYGGYASLLALLRYPDVFAAASSGSPVTDWRLYDSIYTERYMGLPAENAAGYDAGSAMKLASNLKGRLLLYFGTSDDNVHPSNTFQFVQALDRAGKSYDLAVGVDRGHSGVSRTRELEFFVDTLILGQGR